LEAYAALKRRSSTLLHAVLSTCGAVTNKSS
jgi:hypothetical protein